MAASVRSGYLTFGLISMPVRLFSAARGSRVEFHMLHRDDHVRIKQQLYCPQDERVVTRDEIVKGHEYEKGEYVVISAYFESSRAAGHQKDGAQDLR